MVISRGEVYLVVLDPTLGSEIQKTRPCVIISPDEMNHAIHTVIIAPLTSQGKPYPSRVACKFRRKAGLVVLDQIRTVDRIRLVRRLGVLDPGSLAAVLSVLVEMFSP